MQYVNASILLFIFLFCGCVTTPIKSTDIKNLQEDVSQLQIEYRELKQNHADLYTKVDHDSSIVNVLNANILDLQSKISFLNQTIDDLEHKLDTTKSKNANSVLIPSSLYQRAYGDYLTGKFELAHSSFKSFIEKYPNSELAPQAQFHLGECFYSKNIYIEAMTEYKKVEQDYNKSNLVPSARLKIALCCEKTNDYTTALKVFKSIITDFPKTQEATTSEEQMKKYSNNVQKE